MSKATEIMFTQIHAKKGIAKFGGKAIAALFKEFKQLNDKAILGCPVVVPIDPTKLSKHKNKSALNTFLL